jgi:cell wall-associated NlpC family hydrolase
MATLGRALLLAFLLLLLGVAATAPAAHAQEPECSEAVYDADCEDPTPGEDPDPWEAPDVPQADEPWLPETDPTPEVPEIIRNAPPTVSGKKAQLRRNGKAAIPRGAPKRIRAIIAAANKIVGKPYKWGGGHAKIVDRGYDCSGAVSFALIRTGILSSPLTSGGFARWGARGRGRWVTIYANRGHVYMEVAGLRFDTSAVADPGGRKGARWRPAIGKRKGFKVRRPAGL